MNTKTAQLIRTMEALGYSPTYEYRYEYNTSVVKVFFSDVLGMIFVPVEYDYGVSFDVYVMPTGDYDTTTFTFMNEVKDPVKFIKTWHKLLSLGEVCDDRHW